MDTDLIEIIGLAFKGIGWAFLPFLLMPILIISKSFSEKSMLFSALTLTVLFIAGAAAKFMIDIMFYLKYELPQIIHDAFSAYNFILLTLFVMLSLTFLWNFIDRDRKFLNPLSAAIISLLDGINYRLGELSKWLLVAMVMLIVISVVGLSIFGLSFTKLDELPIYLHATVIMLGSAATLLAGQHVRVDIFHTRYSPNKKARLDIFGYYLFIAPVCLTLLWSSQSFVAQSWIAMEGSAEADGLGGLFLLKTLIPLFALTVLTQGFAIVLRAAMALTGQARPQRPEHIPPLFGHTPKTKADPS